MKKKIEYCRGLQVVQEDDGKWRIYYKDKPLETPYYKTEDKAMDAAYLITSVWKMGED